MRYSELKSTKFDNPYLMGETNDCAVLALEKAFNIHYNKAYAILQLAGRRENGGFHIKKLHHKTEIEGKVLADVTDKYRADGKSLEWFLDQKKRGTYIVSLTAHVVAVINGVYYDTRKRAEARETIHQVYLVVKKRHPVREYQKHQIRDMQPIPYVPGD